MRKVLLVGLILASAGPVFATHRFGGNASNFTSGVLDPARLDASSVTMLGPNPRINQPRPYTITVGTSPIQNPDIVTTTHEGLVAAISSASAAGVSDRVTILILDGVYTLDNPWVIPSSVTVIASAGSRFKRGSGESNCIVIDSGTLQGGIYEADGLTDGGTTYIWLKGHTPIFQDFTLADSKDAANTNHSLVKIEGTNSIVRRGLVTRNYLSGSQPIIFEIGGNSSGTIVSDILFTKNDHQTSGHGGISFKVNSASHPWTVTRCQWYDNEQSPSANTVDFLIAASSGGTISDNLIDRRNAFGSSSIVFTTSQNLFWNYVDIRNNTFISGTNVIDFQSVNTVAAGNNNIVRGNTFIKPITSSIKTGRSVSGTVQATFISNNVVIQGPFVSEDAAATNYHHRDNIVNGTMQTDD